MKTFTKEEIKKNGEYLGALSLQYPDIQSAATEIINLNAVLNLPKGTEHFMSDIHGEAEAFSHIVKNASGSIREKIDLLYADVMSSEDCAELAALVYYPEEKIKAAEKRNENMDAWCKLQLTRLIPLCRIVASKYTHRRVRTALPKDFSFILDELIYANSDIKNQKSYAYKIIDTIIDTECGKTFIIAISTTIKGLIVDRLHIVGDIYDRGERPDIVMDTLMAHHSVDIQWGNHDILWMGAASGSHASIANALNNAFSYGNLRTIEVGYGINLRPLALFASEKYSNKSISRFMPKEGGEYHESGQSTELIAKMHKAIAVILLKEEGQTIMRNPDFDMENRLLLNHIDFEKGTVLIDSKEYKLRDTDFPTVDPKDPYKLTAEEENLMNQLADSFAESEKLQRHVKFLFANGGLYLCYNGNLLFHGCIPMNDDSSLMEFTIKGKKYSGKRLLDKLEQLSREGYYSTKESPEKQIGLDYMWFLWAGKNSPLFGRSEMRTFERLLLDDESIKEEKRNAYYELYHNEESCLKILKQFGLHGKHSHIINGHIPVNKKKGESPIKANGRLIVIDGGFCRAYQKRTGTAGYTLVYNSWGMQIISHEQFVGKETAISKNKDIEGTTTVFDVAEKRIKTSATDDGRRIVKEIDGLMMLLSAYRMGLIKEKSASFENYSK